MPAQRKGRAPKNQHKLCKPLPEGEVLVDLRKKSWKIGKKLGSGGFGLIYIANENGKASVKDNAPYVIKVEPSGNGPLYSEIAFYQRVAKPELIDEWKRKKKLSFVPIPSYIAHGLHDFENESLRFLVMPRFGSDIHKLWLEANKQFRRETVAKIAIAMIDALEYMHNREYVHADIKGANILCGYNNDKQVHLVDYGLAYRYMVDGEHKQYKADPKKAHNGTIEYTSTDAHDGAYPSRRGDIEILGFFLLHLLSGNLPWENKLSDCNYVRDMKKKHLKNPIKFVDAVYGSSAHEISQLLLISTKLKYEEEPNYEQLRKLFRDALKSLSVSLTSALDFTSPSEKRVSFEDSSTDKEKPAGRKRKIVTPHPRRNKTRRKSASSLSEDDFELNSSIDDKVPSTSAGRVIPAKNKPSSTSTDESSPVKKPLSRRKKNLVFESDDSMDSLKASKPKKNHHLTQKKPKSSSARQKRIPLKTRDSNSENDSSPLPSSSVKIPKQTKPPTLSKTKPSVRKVTPVKRSSITSSSSNEAGDNSSELSVASPKKITKSSRHSMAPLHTEPVLTDKDKLTKKVLGKHPVFSRRRPKVSQSDAFTQTTPTLRRTAAKK